MGLIKVQWCKARLTIGVSGAAIGHGYDAQAWSKVVHGGYGR